jgi:dCTP deaminase
MILSDRDIAGELNKGSLKIIPCEEKDIQPCSVDLHLGKELLTLGGKKIDLSKGSYKLKPQEFILGSTEEYVEIPTHLCGQVDGRSSIARLGVSIHQTGGYIDAGFNGNITLELFNASDREFELCWGDSICQLIIHMLYSRCVRPYGSTGLNSKYQGSEGTVRSKYEPKG